MQSILEYVIFYFWDYIIIYIAYSYVDVFRAHSLALDKFVCSFLGKTISPTLSIL